MQSKLAIAATLGAGLAILGAVSGAMVADYSGIGTWGAGLLTLLSGAVMGVAGVAGSSVLRDAEVDERATVDSGEQFRMASLVHELERLAASRASDVRLTLSRAPREMLFALEQLADRMAEDHRKMAEREAELRDLQSRNADMVRQLYSEVERQQAEVKVATGVRDAFLARMSHELRTPLNAILGYVELITEELEDETLLEDLGRVRSSAMSLLAIVTTILDLTQLETNSFDVVPEAVDLSELMAKVEESVRDEARSNGNTLTFRIPEIFLYLDRRMVQSILYNLTFNACKYTSNGEVVVEVEDRRERVLIRVIDNGIGMTERQIEEAFRPFGQADESSTRRYDGAGLGLAVVRGFAEAMGGNVHIESTLGKGATVEVDLPIQCDPRTAGFNEDGPTLLVR